MMTDVTVPAQLPGPDRAGHEGEWLLPTGTGADIRLRGAFLGVGSSRRDHHVGPHTPGPAGGEVPDDGTRCSRCRWFEPRIFRDDDRHCYVIHNAGRSDVPGEVTRYRVERVYSALEVVEVLTTRRSGGPRAAFLTVPAARVLAAAAAHDPALHEAYLDRAVS